MTDAQNILEEVRDHLDTLLLEAADAIEKDLNEDLKAVIDVRSNQDYYYDVDPNKYELWLVRVNPVFGDIEPKANYISSGFATIRELMAATQNKGLALGSLAAINSYSAFSKLQNRIYMLFNTTFGERNTYMTIHPYFIKPGLWNIGAVAMLWGKPNRMRILLDHPQFIGENRIKFAVCPDAHTGGMLCRMQFISDDTAEDIRSLCLENPDIITALDNERLLWLSQYSSDDLSKGALPTNLRKQGVVI